MEWGTTTVIEGMKTEWGYQDNGEKGILSKFWKVLYKPTSLVGILSFSKVPFTCRIKIDTGKEKAFNVYSNNEIVKFERSNLV